MADIDCNSEMIDFHRDKVTLGVKQQNQMRVNRNAGRSRLDVDLHSGADGACFEMGHSSSRR